ncbi:MAG: hypothetical protein GX224_01660 [Thermoplasmatales archaeon]|nr:hypothetical protein [Thermoplasmatales archaeon]
MNRKAVGIALACALAVLMVSAVATYDWDYDDTAPTGIDVGADDTGTLQENSIAYVIFEKHGVLTFVLAVLMFSAMIGGVCISREEVDSDDSD